MSTSIFDGYDEEYVSITSQISETISDVSQYEEDNGTRERERARSSRSASCSFLCALFSVDKKLQKLQQCKRLIDQAHQLVRHRVVIARIYRLLTSHLHFRSSKWSLRFDP
jgi:hypothetical protein